MRPALNWGSMRDMRVRSAVLAAIAGVLAGGVALGVAELVAGLVPGAPSPVTEIGALLIAFQPRGAQQFVVSLLGTADKPVLIIAVAIGGLLISAGLGVIARSGTRFTWGIALAGFAALGVLALVAAFRDPLADPTLALGVFALSLASPRWVLSRLLRLAAAFESGRSAEAEMPDWSRRRFIGNSLTLGVTAVAAGAIGRTLLTLRDREAASVEMPPAPVETAPPLPGGASLDVAGITPLVVPNSDFYRIDTQLFTPRLNATDWKLTVTGMVDKPLTFTYASCWRCPFTRSTSPSSASRTRWVG